MNDVRSPSKYVVKFFLSFQFHQASKKYDVYTSVVDRSGARRHLAVCP